MAIEIRTFKELCDNVGGTEDLVLMNDIECGSEEFNHSIECDIDLNGFALRHLYVPSNSSILIKHRVHDGFILGVTENSFNPSRTGATSLFTLNSNSTGGGILENVTLTATVDSLKPNSSIFEVNRSNDYQSGFIGCNCEIIFNNARNDEKIGLIKWYSTVQNLVIKHSRFKVTCPGIGIYSLFHPSMYLPGTVDGCLFEGDYKYFVSACSSYCNVYNSIFMPKQEGKTYVFANPGYTNYTKFYSCLYNSDLADIATTGLIGLTDVELNNPDDINSKGGGFTVIKKDKR